MNKMETEEEEDEEHGRFSRQMSERSLSRPSTPKWWRPSHPPETYEWEEMRRKRRQGGYPWTHLDKKQHGESDHIYETVSPPDVYSSGLIGGDPETSSLDRHTFNIPPELDIVSSEGLDGLDLPDPHDFGMDGEKEWSLFYEDDKHHHQSQPSPRRLFAGVRTELPRLGETSSMRPLAQGMSPLEQEQKEEDIEIRERPLEIREDEEETLGMEMEVEEVEMEDEKGSKVKSKPRWRLGKISFPIKPKFNTWTGIKLLKKKGSSGGKGKVDQGSVDDIGHEVKNEPIPGPSAHTPTKLKIHFDDSLDLSLRPPSPKTPKMETKFKQSMESLPPETVENLEEIKHQAKLEQERMREEAKRLKLEKAQREEEEKAELRRVKAEEKLAKEREKAEGKRAKEEEKLKQKEEAEFKKLKQEEEAEFKKQKQEEEAEFKKLKHEEEVELKKQKQEEEAELKRRKHEEAEELKQRKLKEEAEAKLLKELELEELQLMKKLEVEELKSKKINEDKELKMKVEIEREAAQTSKKKEEELKLDQLEAEIMESILKEQETPKTPKSSKMEYFKKRLGDINCSKKFKRTPTQPPLRPSPPTFKFTQSPQEELATQYRHEIQTQLEAMETYQIAPEPQILVTQPSVEFDSETHAQWEPSRSTSAQGQEEDEVDVESGRKRGRKPIGQKLKGLGQRSKSVAEQTSKRVKQGVSGFGKRMSAKYTEAMNEMRAQEEARRLAQEEKEKRKDSTSAPSTPKVFRFKRKFKKDTDDSGDHPDVPPPVIVAVEKKKGGKKGLTKYENVQLDRSILLGRADRDWESPRHLPSRDESEERNASRHEISSGCESPQCSSMTSSSVHVNVQRSRGQGVLEEIDSDEFFLRERGLSEGEDAVEVNRFLVKELREAFRPSHVNALSAFDTPPPARPSRSTRSTRRKPPETPFQTFPPERPKRKQPQHFVSTYVESLDQEESEGEGEEEEEKGEPLFPFPSDSENEDEKEEEEEDEGMRRLRAQLDKMEEDGGYEEVKRGSPPPTRPRRSKKEKSPPPRVYYNTVGGGEDWRGQDEIEIQELTQVLMEMRNVGESPIPPKRGSKKNLAKSQESMKIQQDSFEGNKEIELHFVDDWGIEGEILKEPPKSEVDDFENFEDYLDGEEDEGSGYAHVEKSPPQPPPATVPRRKRKQKQNGRQGNSLKRRSREMAPPSALIFSLPRFTPRTFHIVPPSRPHRTYSTLRPKRPPRKVRGKGQEVTADSGESVRPSSRVMRDRPLPPPPRPPRPTILYPLNDLDQERVERSLGVSHYANWEDEEKTDGATQRAVVEEVCTAKNISLLGGGEETTGVGIQTDPLSEEDFDYNNPPSSFEEEEVVERTHKLADSVDEICWEERRESERVVDAGDGRDLTLTRESLLPISPHLNSLQPAPPCDLERASVSPLEGSTQLIFPTRLHLDELEVDFLRVRELCAGTLTMDHIHSPLLEVDNLTSSNPLSVPSIHTTRISTENLQRAGDTIPSIPPDSFYDLLLRPSGHGRPGEGEGDPPLEPIGRSVPPCGSTVEDDDVIDLGMRLGRSLVRSGMRAIQGAMEFLEGALPIDPESEQKQRTHLQVMLCILLFLLTGIFLLTRSETRHPHWDFYLPPTDI